MILLDLFQSACSRQPFQFVFHQELSLSILYLLYEDSSLFRAALFIIYKVLIVSEEFHISDIVKVVWWDGANLFKFRKVKIEKKRKKCKLYFDQSHLVKYSKTFNISNLFLADLNFIWKPASNFTISLSSSWNLFLVSPEIGHKLLLQFLLSTNFWLSQTCNHL